MNNSLIEKRDKLVAKINIHEDSLPYLEKCLGIDFLSKLLHYNVKSQYLELVDNAVNQYELKYKNHQIK